MVLAPGHKEKVLTQPPSHVYLAVRHGHAAAEPLLGPWATGRRVMPLGSALAMHAEHVLGSLRELTTQSPREGLRKSHHPLPAAWPSSSGFL